MASEVFGRIYREHTWGEGESLSGPGSSPAAARRAAQVLVELVDELRPMGVLDVGCGDSAWQPPVVSLGVDVAVEAIAAARARHPGRRFEVHDVVRDGVPPRPRGPWGLIVCRDAIQHLSLEDGTALLRALLDARPAHLLLSTYVDGSNVNVRTGGAYRPNLEAWPFNMPPALRHYRDGFDYNEGLQVRDPGKMLALWSWPW